MSAVLAGVKEIREQVDRARQRQTGLFKQTTVLFVDEIHRFNKAQQDALLPHVERGTVVLIGATTENPSFEVNAALLSRCKVLVLESHAEADLRALLDRAMNDQVRGLSTLGVDLADEASVALLGAACGDARTALNTLEVAARAVAAQGRDIIDVSDIEEAVQRPIIRYDKAGDQHYRVVSAFIKSLRGSDPDAALHYMVRMLEAGEDPLFVLRRMVIFASEDIGNADPEALRVAVAATEAFRLMGMPEGALPMTQCATYLACAPKSNAVIVAYKDARKDVLANPGLGVPKHIINAPTPLDRSLGAGRGYKYPHEFAGHYVPDHYLPDELRGRRYYHPSDQGYEREVAQRLERWRAQRDAVAPSDD
ncbi:MAG: replication-associated recombination protein A [bacterium]